MGDDPGGLDRGAVGISVLAQVLPYPCGPTDGGAGWPRP